MSYIQFEIQAAQTLPEEELIEIVGRDRFERIKAIKPGGIFKAWIIAHEGDVKPMVVWSNDPSIKGKQIHFTRAAVQSAFNKIKNGLKFFRKHNQDNSTEFREDFGTVVGKTQKMHDGKLATIVVGHFDADHKEAAEKSNMVSMEAVWNFGKSGKDFFAKSIEKFTGIAMDRSEEATPVFPLAREVATVQASAATEEKKVAKDEIDYRDLEFIDVQRAVNRLKIRAWQLYTPKDVVGKRIIKNGIVSYIEGDREFQEYIESEIVAHANEQLQALQTENESLKQQLAQLGQQVTAYTARPKIEQVCKDLKLPQRVLNLAVKNIESFEAGENEDESIKKYLDRMKAQDAELVSLGYGVSETKISEGPALGPTEDNERKNPFLEDYEQ